MDRTCSACALASTGSPVDSAGSRTWKGWTRSTFKVTGTTVSTPRPSLVAVLFASSLLTMTAGRLLLASAPRTGPDRSRRCHPGASGRDAICQRDIPGSGLAGAAPFTPSLLLVIAQLDRPQQSHGFVHNSRTRANALLRRVGIQEFDVFVGQAHTDFHAIMPTR